MTNRKQTIDKIMKEFAGHNLEPLMIASIYDMAIVLGVPENAIYPGMHMLISNYLGMKDSQFIEESGKALFDYSVEVIKKENPDATNEDIAQGIEMVAVDKLKSMNIPGLYMEDIKEASIAAAKEFVKKYTG